MKAVVQRVTSANVAVSAEAVGQIGVGLLVLVGVETGDGPSDAHGLTVATGEFQAMMQVSLVNDGPVTLLLDSRRRL